jgi:hypothetical protein
MPPFLAKSKNQASRMWNPLKIMKDFARKGGIGNYAIIRTSLVTPSF